MTHRHINIKLAKLISSAKSLKTHFSRLAGTVPYIGAYPNIFNWFARILATYWAHRTNQCTKRCRPNGIATFAGRKLDMQDYSLSACGACILSVQL
jgi:hypothetical protein